MVRLVKPNKRVILYWFFDKGFFFIITSLLLLGTYLRYFTQYYVFTLFTMQLVIVTIVFSLLLLIYEWFMTEYYFFDTHLLIRDIFGDRRVKYSDIKDVGYYGNLLQHLMGTTNVSIKTKDDKECYIRGVNRYKEIENEILTRSIKP